MLKMEENLLQLLRLQIINNSLSRVARRQSCQERCKFYKLLLILYPFIKLVEQIGMKRAALWRPLGSTRSAKRKLDG